MKNNGIVSTLTPNTPALYGWLKGGLRKSPK